MMHLTLTTRGILALSQQRAQRDNAVETVVKAAQLTALREYAQGGLPGAGLADRFKPSAFGLYGFTPRSRAYQKAQVRATGTLTPYVSNRGKDYTKVAVNLLRGNVLGAIQALAAEHRANNMHLRDQVRIPGVGYTVKFLGKSNQVAKAVLRLPAARILNRGGARTQRYRQQLLDLSLGGGRDARAIAARFRQMVERDLANVLSIERSARLAVP